MPMRGEQVRGRGKWRYRPAVPMKPWRERLMDLLRHVGAGGITRYNAQAGRPTQSCRDVDRAIKEGFLRIGRLFRYTTVKTLTLTPAGRALIQAPSEPAAPQPFAKRRAGLAEFAAVNARRHDRATGERSDPSVGDGSD